MQKCQQCKIFLSLEQFKRKLGGQLTKYCISCLEKARLKREKEKCEHGRQRWFCRSCGGSQICKHGKQRSICSTCGGLFICPHGRQKSHCKPCGGSQICLHDRRISDCRECGGSNICEHNKQRRTCLICDPLGHLVVVERSRIYSALKNNREVSSKEYLSCDIEELRAHIESQFKEGMSWNNYGSEWHIDHKVPLKYKGDGETLTLEQVKKRLHYTNTQPLWAKENITKGNRYISE